MLLHTNDRKKDVFYGLKINRPMVFIPWDIKENEFIEMFKNHNIRKVVEKNYFIEDVDFLNEKNCNMGVAFKETLYEISFSRQNYNGYDGLIKSFENFQISLEKAYGKPNKRKEVLINFESCEWNINKKIKIFHYVIDRFGLEEHLCIENTTPVSRTDMTQGH